MYEYLLRRNPSFLAIVENDKTYAEHVNLPYFTYLNYDNMQLFNVNECYKHRYPVTFPKHD